MKNILIIPFLFFSFILLGQSEYEKNYFATEYNDTFKNESIVTARLMEEYTYTSLGINDYKVNVVFRAQYLLKDISALSNFSTLYKNKDLKRYELRQVKPGGKVNVIFEYFDKNYPDDGYERTDDEIEESEKNREEIPLENLEIGDIIDYKYEYTYTTKTKDFRKVLLENGKFDKVKADVRNYNPYKYLLFKNKFIEDNYPIASSVIVIHVPEDLKLIQKSINNNFKFTSKSSGGKTTYQCLITLVNSFKSEEFSYFYLHHPVIKYALIQNSKEKQGFYPYQFVSENVSKEEIVAMGRKFYLDKNYIPRYLYYLNTQKSNTAYADVSLDKFFSSFLKTFTKRDKDKYSKLNKLHEYLTNDDELNESVFGEMSYTVIMARFCDKIGIKYKILACLHNYDGKWSEIISPYEITWGLYIPRKDRDLYVTSYTEESNIYQRFGSLSGTDLIVFDPKKTNSSYEILTYPEVPAEENLYIQNSTISISEDTDFDYTFINTYSMKGAQKYSISETIKSQFDHENLRTPYHFFGLVNYGDLYNFKEFTSNEEWFDEANRIDSSYRMYFKEYYKSRMQTFLYSEYLYKDILVDSSRVYEDGTYPDDESVDYGFKVVFKANGILESGSNDSLLTMNLGSLMTEQYHIPNYKVEERNGAVHNSNLKNIQWKNTIELPKGYTCVNLDDFNVNFENEAGIFRTSAKIEDGRIIFSVEKIYKTHYLPKEKWMEMVDFLHAAETMFLKKLLLKK